MSATKNPEDWRKTLEVRAKTNNKLNPHTVSTPEIEPGPHCWEASVLTTALSLSPLIIMNRKKVNLKTSWNQTTNKTCTKQIKQKEHRVLVTANDN